MCGIAGFSLSPTDNMAINSKGLAKQLLLGIEHRGRDATGFAYRDSTGQFQIHKRPVTASDFVRRALCLPKKADLAICHTRMWTKGDPEHNENNHPIPSGSVVGVHNGWLTNYTSLWGDVVKRERRAAEVDSEVIFAMLAHGWEDSGADIIQALEAIKGNAAVAWLDKENPDTLYLARGYASPLYIGQTNGGSLIFASEDEVVADAAEKARLELTHLREVQEGTLLVVDHGEVLEVNSFKPTGPGSYRSPRSSTWATWDDEWMGYDFVDTRTHYSKVRTLPKPKKSAVESARTFMREAELAQADVSDDDTYAVSVDWIDRRLFDEAQAVAGSTPEAYYSFWEKREHLIDDWFLNFRGDLEQMCKTGSDLKAFVRPGMFVTTTFMETEVQAQVVMVPHTWPSGRYVLRCFVPKGDGKVETVLVERIWNEFHESQKSAAQHDVENGIAALLERNPV